MGQVSYYCKFNNLGTSYLFNSTGRLCLLALCWVIQKQALNYLMIKRLNQ